MAKNLVNRNNDQVLSNAMVAKSGFVNFTGFPDNMQTDEFGGYNNPSEEVNNFTVDSQWNLIQNKIRTGEPLVIERIPIVIRENVQKIVKETAPAKEKMVAATNKIGASIDKDNNPILKLVLLTVLVSGFTAALVK